MTEAHASRLALVIGNGTYQNVSSLDTPVNDANEMAAVLKELGFKVILKPNVQRRAMIEAVQQNFIKRWKKKLPARLVLKW